MTSTTDVSPPADDPGVTTEPPQHSPHRPSRLNQALAWVGIVAGGVFIVAAIFFSGFFLARGFSGPWHHHMGPGTMDCCAAMKADEHMKPGAMMGPGDQMTPGSQMPMPGMMSPGSHMMPGGMMPGGMMGPAAQSPKPRP